MRCAKRRAAILSPEEDTLLLDLLGKLKMTYLEVNQAIAAQAQAQTASQGKNTLIAWRAVRLGSISRSLLPAMLPRLLDCVWLRLP